MAATNVTLVIQNDNATCDFDLPTGESDYAVTLYQLIGNTRTYVCDLDVATPPSAPPNHRTYSKEAIGATGGETYEAEVWTIGYFVASDTVVIPLPVSPSRLRSATKRNGKPRTKKSPSTT